MCEKVVTEAEVEELSNNLLAGFLKWKAGKGEVKEVKTETAQEFLSKHKTCSKCAIQNICRNNPCGYYEDWAVEDELRHVVNRPKHHGEYQSCCRWDAETMQAVYKALEEAKEKGEVIA